MSEHCSCGHEIRPCHLCGDDRCYECDPIADDDVEVCHDYAAVECSESDLGEVPDGQ